MLSQRDSILSKSIILAALLFSMIVVGSGSSPKIEDPCKDMRPAIDTLRMKSTMSIYMIEKNLEPYELTKKHPK